MPSVLFDAVVVPRGAGEALAQLGQAVEFIKDQFRHCKVILAMGGAETLLTKAGIPGAEETENDFALIRFEGRVSDGLRRFIEAASMHRNWDRQVDPPLV
jgi:catalase